MKKAVIVGMSNGKSLTDFHRVFLVQCSLESLNLFDKVEICKSVFVDEKTLTTLSPIIRAKYLQHYLTCHDYDAIFDVSGGDLCNTILPYLDLNSIQNSSCAFFGYSDVSVLLNVLAEHTCCNIWNFPVMSLQSAQKSTQKQKILHCFNEKLSTAIQVKGGNIRCLLKLAGTPYWPTLNKAALLIEALSGKSDRIISLIAQLEAMGVFHQISKLCVGRFIEIENEGKRDEFLSYLTNLCEQYKVQVHNYLLIGHIDDADPIQYANLKNKFNENYDILEG